MGVASLVLGIIGFLFALIPIVGMYAWPVTVLAVVLGYAGLKTEPAKGQAIAGLTLGLLGCALAAFWWWSTREATALQLLGAGAVAVVALGRRRR